MAPPDLIPDPTNPEYAMDLKGRIYKHLVVEMKDGIRVDVGYSLMREDD